MYGGDQQGNAYVDDVLTPATAKLGVTLRRVPGADAKDAMTRILAERRAGSDDGAVDLVWVNGDNLATGKQADAWRCGWSPQLPDMKFVAPDDALATQDFGTDVSGCEAPWHKAQFTLVYDSARVDTPPTSMAGVLQWAQGHPGRFTYPAPPDFTGSVFLREVFYSTAGGYAKIPSQFDRGGYDELTPSALGCSPGRGALVVAPRADLPPRLGGPGPALRRRGGRHDHDLRAGHAHQARR